MLKVEKSLTPLQTSEAARSEHSQKKNESEVRAWNDVYLILDEVQRQSSSRCEGRRDSDASSCFAELRAHQSRH